MGRLPRRCATLVACVLCLPLSAWSSPHELWDSHVPARAVVSANVHYVAWADSAWLRVIDRGSEFTVGRYDRLAAQHFVVFQRQELPRFPSPPYPAGAAYRGKVSVSSDAQLFAWADSNTGGTVPHPRVMVRRSSQPAWSLSIVLAARATRLPAF